MLFYLEEEEKPHNTVIAVTRHGLSDRGIGVQFQPRTENFIFNAARKRNPSPPPILWSFGTATLKFFDGTSFNYLGQLMILHQLYEQHT